MHSSRTEGETLDALAGAAQGGDRAAFERLVVATSPQVLALARRLVGNEHDARDVMQDTYLRAFRAIGRFRGDSGVATWLYRITANCSSTHLARNRRRQVEALNEEFELAEDRPEHDPEAASGASDDRRRLIAALAGLPYDQRAVVVLRDVFDLPHERIASELGISRAAAKVRLHRARRRLREALYPSNEGLIHKKAADKDGGVVLPIEARRRARGNGAGRGVS